MTISLKDDDYGGDTDNNGTNTHPFYIDDYYIVHFYSSSSILDGVIIRYGGTSFKQNVGAIALEENVEINILNSLIKDNNIAVSFPKNTSCEVIEAVIEEWEAQNTIFENNDYLTYPGCE